MKHSTQPEWMDAQILDAMHIRDTFARARDFTNWRIWKNKVNKFIKEGKKSYYITILNKNKDNPQNFWKNFKEIIPSKYSKNPSSKQIEQLNIDKQGKRIAELFNEYFSMLA